MSDAAHGLLMPLAEAGRVRAAWAETCFRQIETICRDFQMASLSPQARAVAEAMEDGGAVDVAVVGRFKAGKSSFLNSLIGAGLMPVGVLPLTSVVARLRYGPKDRVVVRGLDGSQRKIPPAALADYVTEEANPRNARGVALVDIELAALRPYRGLRFVDTPGLGSVFAHNTRTSMDWLPSVGAAMLAVSVDQPLSEHDVELLRELARHTPEITILLTKADLVSSEELSQVRAFILRQVEGVLDKPPRVLPCSVRPGYEALRRAIRDYLLQHVSARREEKSGEILRHKLLGLLAGCREYLRMALSAANAAQDARARLQEQLRQERHTLTTVRNEIWLMSNALQDGLREDALKGFLEFQTSLTSTLSGDLRQKMDRWRGDLAQTTETFDRWAREALTAHLKPLSETQGKALTAGRLAAGQGSFSRVVRAFQDRLAGSIRDALGIAFTGASFQAVVGAPAQPDIRIGRVFDTPIEMLWFLVPMFVFRPLVHRHFLRLLPWEVEKNLCRLAAQWSEAGGRSVDDLARQAQAFLEEELNTIEGLVVKSRDRRPAIEQALAALEGLERMMENGRTVNDA